MFLLGVYVIVIKRIAQWSSESFLEHIRDKVENYTYTGLMKMLKYKNFHTSNAGQNHNHIHQNGIFVKDTDIDSNPVIIEHDIYFSKLSLT